MPVRLRAAEAVRPPAEKPVRASWLGVVKPMGKGGEGEGEGEGGREGGEGVRR